MFWIPSPLQFSTYLSYLYITNNIMCVCVQLLKLNITETKQTSLFLNSVPTLKQNEIPFMQNCDFQPLTPIPFPFLLTSLFFLIQVKDKVEFWPFVMSALIARLSPVHTSNIAFVDAWREFEFWLEGCDDEQWYSFLSGSGSSSLFFCQLLPINKVYTFVEMWLSPHGS